MTEKTNAAVVRIAAAADACGIVGEDTGRVAGHTW